MSDFVEAMLHPSARADALASMRHRVFIAPRLLGSFGAIALFPAYIAWRGAPSALEVIVLGWMIVPMLLAYFLSQTGRYESAHALSSLSLASLITIIAVKTGGLQSFALTWLVVVPLEASLSASRRVVTLAAGLSLGAFAIILTLNHLGVIPQSELGQHGQMTFMALGTITAIAYAAGLAIGSETLTRTTFSLLSKEENRYRLLARNMSDVIVKHGRHGAVEFASPAAEGLLGVPVPTLHGHGLFNRILVSDRPAFLSALADAATGEAEHSVEFRVRRRIRSQGETPEHEAYIWVEMRSHRLAVGDGDGEGERDRSVVSVLRDVSERKANEEALMRARQESEAASAAKGRFLATMSHELRTPLNAIIGFSDMLTRETDLALSTDKRVEYAHLINQSGAHLLAVVNDILDMSKMESGNFEIMPESFAPRDQISNCCDLMALKARERGIDIEIHASEDLPEIFGDRRAFKQILLNLLSNAIKFTDRGGKVTVLAATESGRFKLTISDTGVGISSEDLKRLGNPFFQAGDTYDRRHEGTGLGLSIVKGLVELHNGAFKVASRLDEGTSVTVLLPLEYVPARTEAATSIAPHTRTVPSARDHQVRKRA